MYAHNIRTAFKRSPHNSEPTPVTAPISVGHEWHGSHVFEKDSLVHGEHSTSLSGNVYLTDASAHIGVVNIGLIRGATFLITPQFLGGRASTLANLYQFFRFKKLHIHYIPSVPTTTPGNAIMYYTSNNSITALESGTAELAIASTYNSFVSGPIWSEITLECDLSESLPMYSCVPGSIEESSVQGIFSNGFSNIFAGSEVDGGQLYMQYDIEFYRPRISRTLENYHQSNATLTINHLYTPSINRCVTAVDDLPAAGTMSLVFAGVAPTTPAFGTIECSTWSSLQGPCAWSDNGTGTQITPDIGTNLFFRSFILNGSLYYNFFADAATAESAVFDNETTNAAYAGALCFHNSIATLASTSNLFTFRWYPTDSE